MTAHRSMIQDSVRDEMDTEDGTRRFWYTIPAAEEGAVDIAAEFDVIPNIMRDTEWIARDVDRLDGERIVEAVNSYDRLRRVEAAATDLIRDWGQTGPMMAALRAALTPEADAPSERADLEETGR